MHQRDFYFSLVLIALGAGVIAESIRMPRMEQFGYGSYAAPGLVPGLIGAALAFFGLLLLIRAARARGWRPAESPPAREPGRKEAVRAFGIALGLILVYAVVLVGSVPFWLATFLFLFAFIAYFEWRPSVTSKSRARQLGTALAQAVIVAIAVTFLFERVFRVNLPG